MYYAEIEKILCTSRFLQTRIAQTAPYTSVFPCNTDKLTMVGVFYEHFTWPPCLVGTKWILSCNLGRIKLPRGPGHGPPFPRSACLHQFLPQCLSLSLFHSLSPTVSVQLFVPLCLSLLSSPSLFFSSYFFQEVTLKGGVKEPKPASSESSKC